MGHDTPADANADNRRIGVLAPVRVRRIERRITMNVDRRPVNTVELAPERVIGRDCRRARLHPGHQTVHSFV